MNNENKNQRKIFLDEKRRFLTVREERISQEENNNGEVSEEEEIENVNVCKEKKSRKKKPKCSSFDHLIV